VSADKETLAVYQSRAGDYAKMVETDSPFPALDAFISAIPKGGFVLDLGCGTGSASARMQAAGLIVDAVDASPAMIEQAQTLHGLKVRLATFDEITDAQVYDGVWANFSLLHAPKSAFPRHLAALHRALKSGGTLHLGLKTGTGEIRDRIGRFYALYTETELNALMTAAGFNVTHRSFGEDVGLDGSSSPWIIMTAHA
jgi:SAM-dependent methyltransferase